MSPWLVRINAVLVCLCLAIGLTSLANGEWGNGAAFTVLAAVLGVDLLRRRRGSAAAAEWTPERVRGVVGSEPDDVRAVRALRGADPRLGLADAVGLVRAARAAAR